MQGASEKEERDVKGGGWRIASPETVGGFSGVGFFFAEALREPGVPIGLVHTPMGGTAIETWLPADVIRTLPEAGLGAEFFRRKVAEHEAALAKWREANEEWKKAADQARAEGRPVPDAPPEPKGVARHNLPSALFNGKVRPLQPFAARGVLWYQGESNATDTETSRRYGPMLEALITSWRRGWRDESLPFVIIQLPGYENPKNPTGPDWPGLRAQQAEVVARVAHTHVVVALDLGERGNIHPADKASVGERAARVVRRHVFGHMDVVAEGPRVAAAKREGQNIILRFETTGALEAGPAMLRTDWQVSGADGPWHEAPPEVATSEIRLRLPDNAQGPFRVRYAWQNWTAGAVRDGSGLPLAQFEMAVE
jgi:sialate O-acetylesterase